MRSFGRVGVARVAGGRGGGVGGGFSEARGVFVDEPLVEG